MTEEKKYKPQMYSLGIRIEKSLFEEAARREIKRTRLQRIKLAFLTKTGTVRMKLAKWLAGYDFTEE